jgi:hypothetical protein
MDKLSYHLLCLHGWFPNLTWIFWGGPSILSSPSMSSAWVVVGCSEMTLDPTLSEGSYFQLVLQGLPD